MNGLGRKKDQKDNKSIVFTKETLGIVTVLFATLSLICLLTGGVIFSILGEAVKMFLHGIFGYFAYVVVVGLIFLGIMLVADKKLPVSRKVKVLISLALVLIALIAHIATMSGKQLAFGEYLKESYLMAGGGMTTCSGGGLFASFVAYPICQLFYDVGSYVILSILLVVDVYVLVVSFMKEPVKVGVKTTDKFKSSYVKADEQDAMADLQIQGEKEYPVEVDFSKDRPQQKLFVNNPEDFAVKSARELKKGESTAIKLGLSEGGINVSSASQPYTKVYSEELKSKIDYIKTPTQIDVQKTLGIDYSTKPKSIMRDNSSSKSVYETYNGSSLSDTTVSDYVPERSVESVEEETVSEQVIPFFEHDGVVQDTAEAHAEMFADKYADVEDVVAEVKPNDVVDEIVRPLEDNIFSSTRNDGDIVEMPFIDNEDKLVESDVEVESFIEPEISETPETPNESNVIRRTRSSLFGDMGEVSNNSRQSGERTAFTSRVQADNNLGVRSRAFNFGSTETAKEEGKEEPAQPEKPKPPINREYFRPPFDLLQTYEQKSDAASENHEERMEIIKNTLEQFHINVKPQSYIQGPSITRYEIMMPAGVPVKKVLSYDDDLKMWLQSKNGVRIEAPIPGKNLVGIEVANKIPDTVGLRAVLEGMAGKKCKPSSLIFAIGKNIVGESISDDLAKGPHYLVAGATGSGKSVCLNAMIVSLIMRYSPEDLRLILIDPKRVGFRCYEHLPHLMIDEIITEPKKALAVLQWAYNEMENRYKIFESSPGVISNIEAYNEQIASDTVAKMPRIVVIVDELADLMETCKRDMEAKIRAIAQKARAAGIHLVLATQRPSVDIVTGTIKANLPSRIALKVMNFQDSQTILGEGGAEKLLGNGDMLYKNSGMPGYERYQGAWISDAEINNVVSYIKEHNKAYFDDELQEFLEKETNPQPEETTGDDGEDSGEGEFDSFFLKALWLAVTTKSVSISQLQRRFQIGYARAGGLVDKMERMGFVSGNEGSKARRVILTREEFEDRFGPMNDAY